jgi:hypothetical protein
MWFDLFITAAFYISDGVFGVEVMICKAARKNMSLTVPLSRFTSVSRPAACFFGTPFVVSRCNRVRFAAAILPDQTVFPEPNGIREQRARVFTIGDIPGGAAYSTGTLILGGAG